jgi:hypothetical protein
MHWKTAQSKRMSCRAARATGHRKCRWHCVTAATQDSTQQCHSSAYLQAYTSNMYTCTTCTAITMPCTC